MSAILHPALEWPTIPSHIRIMSLLRENPAPGKAVLRAVSGIETNRGVEKALRRLIDEGWITVTQSGGGRGCPTAYRAHETPSKPRPETPSQRRSQPHAHAVGFDLGFKDLTPSQDLDQNLLSRANRTGFTACPPDFAPSPASLAWTAKSGANGLDLDMQTALFINWHIGHGSRWKDWQHAWRNWMLKALKDNRWNLNRAGAASPASNSRPLFIPSRAEAASIQAKGLTVEEWADHNGYRI